ncbi:MAG: YdhR family protein [Acetobacteraceae bacterium]|nr:YdhR family protein [Acetobacteraceae bacterium]
MFIVQINFEYPNITPAMAASLNTGERAKPFLDVQGLLWKIWLNTEGGPKVGGLYCFDSRANAEAYLAGPIVARIKASPEIANLTAQIYAVTENPSRVTRAPVPFPVLAAE